MQRDTGGYAVALAASMKLIFCGNAGENYFSTSDIGWVVGHSYIVYGPLIAGMGTIMYEWGGESVSDFTCGGCATARTSSSCRCTSPAVCSGGGASEADLMAACWFGISASSPKWMQVGPDDAPAQRSDGGADLNPLEHPGAVTRLVTTAIHMPRSKRAFEVAGFRVRSRRRETTWRSGRSRRCSWPGVGALVVSPSLCASGSRAAGTGCWAATASGRVMRVGPIEASRNEGR